MVSNELKATVVVQWLCQYWQLCVCRQCYVLVCTTSKEFGYFMDVRYHGRLGDATRHCCLVEVATSSQVQQKCQHIAWRNITVCSDTIPLQTPLIVFRCHQIDFLLSETCRKTDVFLRGTRLSAFIVASPTSNANDCCSSNCERHCRWSQLIFVKRAGKYFWR